MKRYFLQAICFFSMVISFQQLKAQDDLLSLVKKDKPKKEIVKMLLNRRG
jgi:hypothetical protein